MYIFGEFHKEQLTPELLNELMAKASFKKTELADTSISNIIEVLNRCAPLWASGGQYFQKALSILESESSFHNEVDKNTLEILPELLSEKSLTRRVRVEFGSLKALDNFDFRQNYNGKIKYLPLGTLLHVTAGNVFLGCIDSLIMGLLTKNVSIIKLSSNNQKLPELFLESLIEADTEKVLTPFIGLLTWKGGDHSIEGPLKKQVDGIIAWGGEEMVESYKKELPLGTPLFEHGPKISFHLITKKFYESGKLDFQKMAMDICLWDQSACANSQNIYCEEGIDINDFISKIGPELENFKLPLGHISENESVEALKEEQEGLYQEFNSGVKAFFGKKSRVVFDSSLNPAPTSLNRSVKVKSFNSGKELAKVLGHFSFYLQTCGLGVCPLEKKAYQQELGLAGVNRFSKIGEMLKGQDGSPHDGRFSLQELTRVVCDENIISVEEFALNQTNVIPYYTNMDINEFSDIPIIDGKVLEENSLYKNKQFLNPDISGGTIFSSGGTTGNPKFCFYTPAEFKRTSELLGKSYLNLGLKQSDRVLNLFMAGNMWSSFSAIQNALDFCEVTQFPLGGMADVDQFKFIVESFKVNVLFGLPSLILNYAQNAPNLKVETVFYAGEAFTQEARDFLKDTWGCENIFSAGYASVDVGPIGYQDHTCQGNEHYLFEDLIHLEVIDEEAVVTSKIRKGMPILRYRTGDRVKVLECPKGRIKFSLLGRTDSLINIWSSRFHFADIESVLKDFGVQVQEFQIQITQEKLEDSLSDILEIIIPPVVFDNKKIPIKAFADKLYSRCKDLRDTQPFDYLTDKIRLSRKEFLKNAKTGKFKKFIDQRFS